MRRRKASSVIVQPVKLWKFPLALIGVVLCGIAIFGTAVAGLWLSLNRPTLSVATWEAKDTLDLVRIALIVTGGLGGVVALIVSYRKQRLAEDANRREESANTRAEEASLRDETRLFNERFIAASQLLGHEQAMVRMTGIQAISGLADDWRAGRQTCINVLCSYLRMPYQPDPNAEEGGWLRGEQEVRLIIITIIRDHLRLDPAADARSWRGHDLDFTGAVFDGGDFAGAHFTGPTSFSNARFSGGTVRFSKATFANEKVSFDGAEFLSSTVWFDATTFSDGDVGFWRAKFSGGTVAFSGARFSGAKLRFTSAMFSGGDVWFDEAAFSGGSVGFYLATFSGTDVDFTAAEFSGGIVGFEGAKFTGGTVDFALAKFSGGTVGFRRARFTGTKVGFNAAEFNGGAVDLTKVSSYKQPPQFDEWTTPPDGLLLPPTATKSPSLGSQRKVSEPADVGSA